jgi:glyoxylase-like metal-dependent hydrolase (beta-lactamase superfamily II)
VVVGGIELEPVVDAAGVLGPLSEVFPGTEAADWDPLRSEHPQLFAGDRFRLSVACYLIRSAGRTVLVDTGVGPPGSWDYWEPEWEGGLLPGLAAHGVTPADVDLVLLTHVHADHVGWNADREGEPLFARYAMHADALAAARERGDRAHIPRTVLGLEDRMETFSGETEVAPGVTTVELPGHDRGHVGVRIGDEAVLIADAAPHPLMLDRPEVRFFAETDHDAAAATRRAIVAELVDRPVLAVCGHYPGGGIGRAVTRDGRVVWEPV